jgi:hypothetical protein
VLFHVGGVQLEKDCQRSYAKALAQERILELAVSLSLYHGLQAARTYTASAIVEQAASAAIDVLFQQELLTFSATNHNNSGTSTLTSRPFATEIMPLPNLLPSDLVCMLPCLAFIILGLGE